MIDLQLTARHHDELDDGLREYIERKIGLLDKYMPKGHEIIRGKVVLELDEGSSSDSQRYSCEARLEVPGNDMFARDATVNFYAAVDIVEQKLKSQILKYKDKHGSHRARGRDKPMVESEDEVLPTDTL